MPSAQNGLDLSRKLPWRGGFGKATPVMVQMGNTDHKATVLSRKETKEEGTDGVRLEGSSPPVLPWLDICTLVCCLPE